MEEDDGGLHEVLSGGSGGKHVSGYTGVHGLEPESQPVEDLSEPYNEID